MKYLILALSILISGCDTDRLSFLVHDASSRPYGTSCEHDYCVISYAQIPRVSFDYEDCLNRAKGHRTAKEKLAHGEWCACVSGNFSADLGVGLYKCGVKYPFKVYEVKEKSYD